MLSYIGLLTSTVMLSYIGLLTSTVMLSYISLLTSTVMLSYISVLTSTVMLSYISVLTSTVMLNYIGVLTSNVMLSYIGVLTMEQGWIFSLRMANTHTTPHMKHNRGTGVNILFGNGQYTHNSSYETQPWNRGEHSFWEWPIEVENGINSATCKTWKEPVFHGGKKNCRDLKTSSNRKKLCCHG